MSSFGSDEVASSTPVHVNEANEHIPTESSQLEDNRHDSCPIKKRQKTSTVDEFSTSGSGASTSHLKSQTERCLQRRLHMGTEKKKPMIPFQPTHSANPFLYPSVRYSNEKMREIIATAIMVHELPLSIVENEVWMWAFQYANSNFQKVSRKEVGSGCLALYVAEKKRLKALLKTVVKINLTIDMWKSSHQVVEYMVITAHFIDAGWKLQKRVLSFVKVPSPRSGIDVADAIFKCLKEWGIEDKVFSACVDNASYNDLCLRYLKDNLSLSTKLVLNGDLFHVRCCAHILNLLVQDGFSKIKNVIHNIRESIKYISQSDSRLIAFCDVVEQKHIKERKLIIDCPTRWNSTFQMLSTALNFKIAFSAYEEREPYYNFGPSHDDWEKLENIRKLLVVFNLATHVISGSEYPTANLYLVEVCLVKQVLDNTAEDKDLFLREVVAPMKVKFDKYWGECNLLMAIASVLDPRCKFHIVDLCFPSMYKSEKVAKENVDKVRTSLQKLYNEYVALSVQESSTNEGNISGSTSATSMHKSSVVTGFDYIMSFVRAKEAVSPTKSELDIYLEEGIYILEGDDSSFSALEWWKNNSLKYKVLSKMAADILLVPISTVASEATFSAGETAIDECRSMLNEKSIEALICGGDWLRHKYGLKKKSKVDEHLQEINLKI